MTSDERMSGWVEEELPENTAQLPGSLSLKNN